MMASLTKQMLIVLILIHLSCGGEPTWALRIEDWPEDADVLEVQSWVNGRETESFIVSREQGKTGFGVRLPEGFMGNVKLLIWALDSTGCKVATREVQQDLGPGLRVTVEQPSVRLTPLSDAICPLEIIRNQDNFVYVTSEPPGIDCGPKCRMEITRGHLVRLSAQAGIKISWSNPRCRDAAGPTRDCTVAIMGGTKLITSRYELLKPKMHTISPGCLLMGDEAGERHSDNSQWGYPQHDVLINHSFEISETEITQQNFSSVMGQNPSWFKGPELPVESVSWLDAVRYCNRLSMLEGLDSCYQIGETTAQWKNGFLCSGYRLPTEAEWEYSAKAPKEWQYSGAPCIDDVTSKSIHSYFVLDSRACFSVNSAGHTCSVKDKIPNYNQLYGMSGNVSEWVWDGFGYYDKLASNQVDPTGDDLSIYKSVRGGSYNSSPGAVKIDMYGREDYAGVNIVAELRTTARSRQPSTHKSPTVGFRIARTLPPTTPPSPSMPCKK